jgi:hypothetical protein
MHQPPKLTDATVHDTPAAITKSTIKRRSPHKCRWAELSVPLTRQLASVWTPGCKCVNNETQHWLY